MEKKTYTYKEAFDASMIYFNNDSLAADTFIKKYALKNKEGFLVEKTPDDMHRRLSKEFARIEKKKFKKPLTEQEIYNFMQDYKRFCPAGSPSFGVGNPYFTVSLSNCFAIDPPCDAYSGIMRADEEIVQIGKRRGGVGADIEKLRPEGSPTNNAAQSSTGTIPFLKRYSNSVREVAQKGRRGALLVSNNIHHPECVKIKDENYKPTTIVMKREDKPDKIISSLYYDPQNLDFVSVKQDETQVTGANLSVKLTDEFMNAVKNNTDFEQRWPVDSKKPKISQMVSAKKAWEKIIYSAWSMGEPGLLMWDNIIRESISDCYADFQTTTTNPCGEIILSPNGSCILSSLNLFSYVTNPFTEKASFDFNSFYKDAQTAHRLMDDIIDLEQESILKIIDKIKQDPEDDETKCREFNLWTKIYKASVQGRRTGLGITALGDCLAGLNFKYDSEESLAIIDNIFKTFKLGVYRSSVDIAKELGAFEVWDHELEKNNPFLLRIKEQDIQLWEDMKIYGRRNISCLTVAPTGTVSLMTQTTSGIEPLFNMEKYIRRKKINSNDLDVRVDFVDNNGDKWQEFEVDHKGVSLWKTTTGKQDIKESPYYNSCAVDVDWIKRIKVQSIIQKHIDHSISSTLNLPTSATTDDVSKIYMSAWELGLKGVTVYRAGSRDGVMIEKKNDCGCRAEKICKNNAPKRPEVLPCDIYNVTVKGEDFFVLIGMYQGDPYEVFAGKDGNIKKGLKTGWLKKLKRGCYAICDEADDECQILHADINKFMSDEQIAITRMISTALRHGADVHFVVHQLEKIEGDLLGFTKAIVRVLKKYVKEGVKVTGEVCPECGGELRREGGCCACIKCGWSKCS